MFMEALQTALFENPLGIYIALAIVAVLGLISYQNWRTFKSAWLTIVALIAGATVFTVSTLVVTDREKIRAACDEIAKALNNRNMLIVEHFLDRDFTGQGRYKSRKQTLARLARDLKDYRITSVELKILNLNARDDLATMLVRSDIKSKTIGAIWLKWRVVWIKQPKGWLVYKVKGPEIGPADAENEK